MVNEFVYCPRLFFYEWVEGVFRESADTVEGTIQHQRVDERATELPAPGSGGHRTDPLALRHAVERAAARDREDGPGGRRKASVTPVDYKHGRPREGPDGLEMWPADRAQLAVQGLVLRENGYRCEEGIVYYRKTGQRVRVAFDAALVAETERIIAHAWALATIGEHSAAA